MARDVVLANVRRSLTLNRRELVAEVRSAGDLELAHWLAETGHEIADVLKAGSWTGLRRAAGLPTPDAGTAEVQLLKRVASLLHVDDTERALIYRRLLIEPVDYAGLGEREQRYARMLFFSLWPNGGGLTSYQAGLDLLHRHPAVADELHQMVGLGLAGAEHVAGPLEAGMAQVTLRTGARYSREETLAALDWASLTRKPSAFVAGVVWSQAVQTDAFFVTLRKNEREYSPTTMYRDYALSPELFHWESQNATAVASPTGQRYLHHRANGSHVLLLARQEKSTEWGGPAPFLCLGPASYVSHRGERPIAITWRLRHPMPAGVFRRAAVTA